jgi:hypothetical protein
MQVRIVLGGLLFIACSHDGGSTTGFAESGGGSCTPGAQQACACPGGGPDGVQVCEGGGDRFGPCTGCATDSDSSDEGSPSSSGELAESSSGEAVTITTAVGESSSEGGVSEPYVFEDCLIDTPRNGSEVCDDTGFTVPDASPPNVLVCLEATGGQIYIATNSTVDPTDGAMRCSGWELNGQNPWDHLDYVVPALTCDVEQKTLAFDISSYAGQTLWFGAHDNPAGGGSGTTACIARAK